MKNKRCTNTRGRVRLVMGCAGVVVKACDGLCWGCGQGYVGVLGARQLQQHMYKKKKCWRKSMEKQRKIKQKETEKI